MMVSKRNLLFQGFIFRFHVKLPGCIIYIIHGCYVHDNFFHVLNLDNWDMILFSKSCRGQIARGCEDVADTNHGGEAQNDQQNSKGYGFRTCKHVENPCTKKNGNEVQGSWPMTPVWKVSVFKRNPNANGFWEATILVQTWHSCVKRL